MTTPLDKPVRRALTLKGVEYVVAMSPESIKVTRKGHRLGVEIKWADLISGEAALATALQASLGRLDDRQPIRVGKLPSSSATSKRQIKARSKRAQRP